MSSTSPQPSLATRTDDTRLLTTSTGTSRTRIPSRSAKKSSSMSKANRFMTEASSSSFAASRENAFRPHWVSRPRPSPRNRQTAATARLPVRRSHDASVTATESGWRRSPTAASAPCSTSSSRPRIWWGG